jgi:hypothetical protein
MTEYEVQALLERVDAWVDSVYPKTPAPWALVGDMADLLKRSLSTQPDTGVLWEGPTEPIPEGATGPSPSDASQLVLFLDHPPGINVVVTRKAES